MLKLIATISMYCASEFQCISHIQIRVALMLISVHVINCIQNLNCKLHKYTIHVPCIIYFTS